MACRPRLPAQPSLRLINRQNSGVNLASQISCTYETRLENIKAANLCSVYKTNQMAMNPDSGFSPSDFDRDKDGHLTVRINAPELNTTTLVLDVASSMVREKDRCHPFLFINIVTLSKNKISDRNCSMMLLQHRLTELLSIKYFIRQVIKFIVL